MAKKSELEDSASAYAGFLLKVNSDVIRGDHPQIISTVIGSLPHVVGMLQFEKKYQGRQFASVEIIDLGITSAVCQLDSSFFKSLEAFLTEQKLLSKLLTADPWEGFALGTSQLATACQAWGYLDSHSPCAIQELYHICNDQTKLVDWLVYSWEQNYLVARHIANDTQFVSTFLHPDEKVTGQCPYCGASGSGKRHLFWTETNCPRCNTPVCFVVR